MPIPIRDVSATATVLSHLCGAKDVVFDAGPVAVAAVVVIQNPLHRPDAMAETRRTG